MTTRLRETKWRNPNSYSGLHLSITFHHLQVTRIFSIHPKLLTCLGVLPYSRQIRGEAIEGLMLDELVLIEKTIEKGLNRVLERKVCSFAFYIVFLIC